MQKRYGLDKEVLKQVKAKKIHFKEKLNLTFMENLPRIIFQLLRI